MSSAPDHVNVDLETSLPITGSSDGFTLYKRIDKRNPSRNLPIRSRADWFKHAPPKSPIHIAQGRSAVELIDRWTPNGGSPTIPDELRALMDTHELTTSATISEGFAECTTGLYQPGSPRNHDLLLFGRQQLGSIVVGIEADVDPVAADIGFIGYIGALPHLARILALKQRIGVVGKDVLAILGVYAEEHMPGAIF